MWVPELFRGEALETVNEEVANALTHFVGLILSSFAMYFLVIAAIVFRHSWHHVTGLILFGMSKYMYELDVV
jgi:predicted membrane channel-forming protein YqfA (hemolysin III family)